MKFRVAYFVINTSRLYGDDLFSSTLNRDISVVKLFPEIGGHHCRALLSISSSPHSNLQNFVISMLFSRKMSPTFKS